MDSNGPPQLRVSRLSCDQGKIAIAPQSKSETPSHSFDFLHSFFPRGSSRPVLLCALPEPHAMAALIRFRAWINKGNASSIKSAAPLMQCFS
jgi:hypothetical protein